MNRNQRRYKYKRPRSGEAKKRKNDIEEMVTPRSRHPMHSRCCYVAPNQRSLSKLTNSNSHSQYQNLIAAEPYQPAIPSLETQSVRSTDPELISIAKLKRPTQPDIETNDISKRSYQRTLPAVNKKAQPSRLTEPQEITIIKPYRSKRLAVNMATDPLISTPDVNIMTDQYAPTPATLPDLTIAQLQQLRKVFFPPCHKIEKASQYVKPLGQASTYEEMMQWQSAENVDEIDKVILTGRDEETLTQYHNLPRNMHISEVPRIKLMAVKFTKYKKKNIEVRRLEEKVVCVEYDVFDKEVDDKIPVQKMRAFFTIKPVVDDKAKELTELPTTTKNKFNISTTDLQKLNQKEIEIIDGKVLENRPYLDDLRKLLRRKENAQRNNTTLNLQALYEMGKRDLFDFNTNIDTNTMPKEELVEMQNFILQNCKSSVHGIRRRTLKNSSKVFEAWAQNTMSRSLLTELLTESNKNVHDF